MEDTFLKKNLEQISRYDKELALKIEQYCEFKHKFEFSEAKSGDTNLLFDGSFLHNDVDPKEEALNIYGSLSDNFKSSVNVVFGLGLGYLFKRLSLESRGKIIIYEPSYEILKITLSAVDLSEDLSKENVIVAADFEALQRAFDKLYFDDAQVHLCALPSYKNLFPAEYAKLIEELSFLKGLFASNYLNLFKKCYDWTVSTIDNLPEMLCHEEIESLRGKFAGKPAVIVSAGPSLDKNIDVLKQYEGKALIFCVGTALKTAVKHGITPDFLTVVEHNDCSTQVSGIDVSEMNLILQPMTHKVFHNLHTKRKFNYYPNNDFAIHWLKDIIGVSLADYYNKGTVSLCALFSAKIMGCSPIILMGQDLAYTNGECYAKDSAYGGLKCVKNETTGEFEVAPLDMEKYLSSMNYPEGEDAEYIAKLKLDDINQNLYFVKGQNGEMLPTEPGYATFIRYYENAAKEFGNVVKLINSTEGGAYLEGFEHISLKEALEKYLDEKFDAEEIIKYALQNARDLNKETGGKIGKELENTVNIFTENLMSFEMGRYRTGQLKSLFKMKRIYNERFKELCAEILKYFLEVEENVLNKSILIKSMLLPEYTRLTKHLDDSGSDFISSITKFVELLDDFFGDGYQRVYNYHFRMNDIAEKLNDSRYTACKKG